MDIEIEILPDGSFLVPRGTKKHNDVIRQIFDGIAVDKEGLEEFLSFTDDVELIVGDVTLCG